MPQTVPLPGFVHELQMLAGVKSKFDGCREILCYERGKKMFFFFLVGRELREGSGGYLGFQAPSDY
jgi:hypothetical protein